jgi:DNA-binding transcriptional LysR family regulator
MKPTFETIGRRLDLNLLVVFDAIYRSRNLTAAGRALGLSQPAMSHALSRMRLMCKDPLFVRLPRGLQPTPVADVLAPAVAAGLHTLRSGLERHKFAPLQSTRTFRIGMGDIAEWVHLPRLRKAVRIAAPQVALHTMQISGDRLRDALGDGEVDVATGEYDLGAGCRQILLYESSYVCVVSADHPTIGGQLTMRQFKAAEHILVAPHSAFRHGDTIERALRSRKINARIALTISHLPGVMPLLTETDLIATVPARLARAMAEFANLRLLPPPIVLPKIRVSLYWHERFHREPANEWLRDLYVRTVRA